MADGFQKAVSGLANEIKAVEAYAVRAQRETALEILARLMRSTPVDTGRARANWQTTTGAPATGELPKPASKEAGAAQALATGKQAVAQHTPGSSIFITNNLPYTQRLNEGHSAQAPAGFVEQAIKNAYAAIQAKVTA